MKSSNERYSITNCGYPQEAFCFADGKETARHIPRAPILRASAPRNFLRTDPLSEREKDLTSLLQSRNNRSDKCI